MFPSHELVFGTRTNTTDNILFEDDLVVDYAFDPPINNIISFGSTEKQETQTSLGDTNIQREEEMRKIKHRDIERKRREEMSTLYASLRSLLPLDPNKGKLSMSDHMQEAVNYTKQLQKKVQELRTRREILLKDLSTSSGTKNTTSSIGTDHNLRNCVTLNMGTDGMEILISSSINISEFRLSRVIEELHAKELNVVSCVSTKISGIFLHKIQAEFSDLKLNDVSMLQQRLTEIIN